MKKAAVPLDPAKMTAMLRDGVLALTPEAIGLSVEDCPQVWGAMVEFAETEAAVSLVALADGSVSIYVSDGSGVIGCGLHPDVKLAAAKLLSVAPQAVPCCTPASIFPMPQMDMVCVYLFTQQGVVAAQAARADMDEGAVALAEIYYAAHGVIGTVELLGAGVDLLNEMRLAENATRKDVDNDVEAVPQPKSRGRGGRILPYVGTMARRSQH